MSNGPHPRLAHRLVHAARLAELRSSQIPWPEVIALTIIAAAALVLRTIDLTSLPAGLHGDEAIAGMEGQRVLDEGWIGPYSPHAAGQPAGPLYVVAVSVALFGNSIFAVRIVPAIAGVLTVLALYLVARPFFGRSVALAAAACLAVMGWHLHYARIGFPLEWWPLVVIAAAGALAWAVSTGSAAWWAASGALSGVGIYVYNAHPIVLVAFGFFILGFLVCHRYAPLCPDLQNVLLYAVALLIVATPMIAFAANPANGYFNHFERDSITNSVVWKEQETPIAKLSLISERYIDVWDRLILNPELDAVDGTGITKVIPISFIALSTCGLIVALATQRKALIYLALLVIIIMPFASALTVDGLARRTFAMAPFLALFAGLCLVHIYRWIKSLTLGIPANIRTYISSTFAVVIFSILIWTNVYPYFSGFKDSSEQQWVFVAELTEASQFMRNLSWSDYVYFFSDRHSFNYETRQFLAPGVRGEDRSDEFGKITGISLADAAQGRHVFVLIGKYRQVEQQLRAAYPGGTVVAGPGSRIRFIAYIVDDGAARAGSARGDALRTEGAVFATPE